MLEQGSTNLSVNVHIVNILGFMSLIGFLHGTVVKKPPANAGESGDTGLIPGLGRALEKAMTAHSVF